jgi:hypothetical protein
MKADLDLRKVFFQQVVLAGGSTLFPGTSEQKKSDPHRELDDKGERGTRGDGGGSMPIQGLIYQLARC